MLRFGVGLRKLVGDWSCLVYWWVVLVSGLVLRLG